MNGADLLVNILRAQGVSFVATLCGNGLNPLLYACDQGGLRLVDTRNEQSASYLADAYARLTGKIGVCAVSSGIAHVNALAGVTNAYYDGAPLLLISGESDTAATGQGKFQELDQPALAAPVCKLSARVERVENLPAQVNMAIATAQAGRPGPVHLTIPIDVLEADVSERLAQTAHLAAPVRPKAAGDADAMRRALDWIASAKRPLLALGSGAFYAQAGKAAARFMALTDIPTVTPIWDRGVVAPGSKQFLGVIGAASGEPKLLADCDLLILVGARPDYRVGYTQPPALPPAARVVRVDADAAELGWGAPADLNILGDPASVLESWAGLWAGGRYLAHSAWLQEAQRRDQAFHARWQKLPAAPPMTGQHVVEAIRPYLGAETLFLVDGGNIGQWAHMCLANGYPEEWLTCGASAVVGWGLPGAMGARMAYPDKPIILLSGDGAMTFTLAEFESAARQGLPFVVVLADDQAWGIVVCGQRQRYGQEGVLASCMGPIRYDLVAEGLGALGIRAERPEEIGPAIARGLAARRPTLIHVPIATGGPADS
jgi:acetolactate synthase I/II/III large subunit